MRAVNYQVFARKYRPKTFDDVLGQDHVVRTLKNAITQNRLAHAYLFVGPRGTGKTSTSRIFAKALNCTGGPRVDFDPDEDICVEIAEGRSLDVTEIDGASNNSVDDVRALRETVNYAPARGQFRIYYIDEVHMLTNNAFNALLKTLEEPPPHVKFIFATTEAHKILPTILSRCQRFDLRKIPAPLIAQHLLHIAKLENVELETLAAHSIAVGADGGMRDAQSMLDQLVAFCGSRVTEQDVLDVFGFTSHQTVSGLCGAMLRGETAEALNQLYQQAESGKDLSRLLADVIFHFRNVLVYKVDPEIAARDLPGEIATDLATQAEQVNSDKLMQIIDQLAETEAGMRWAPNKRLYFEIGIIRSTQVLGEASLSDVILALRGALDGSGYVPASAAGSAPVRAAVAEDAPRQSMAEAVRAAVKTTPPPAAPPTTTLPAAAPEPEPTGSMVPGPELWVAVTDEMEHRKLPLQRSYAIEASFLRAEGRHFVIGVPESQRGAGQSLERPGARSVVEDILYKLTGQKFSLKVEVSAAVEEAPAPVVSTPLAIPEPLVEKEKPAAKASKAAEAEEAAAKAARLEDEFRDDPLIREALSLFDAKIASVS
jgi:DNA polymerase-3 subunit gamma/tau